MLAALLLGDLVTVQTIESVSATGSGPYDEASFGLVHNVHVVLELLQVSLLLGQLLLQFQQLLLLTLADRIVFVGLLALLEGITICSQPASVD